MQRNRQTQKVRNARRLSLKKEVDHETTTKPTTKTKQPEFKIDDEQNLKDIASFYKKEIMEAKSVFDAAIFDPDVYSFIPNSPEHILQLFSPSNVLRPDDVSMFDDQSFNEALLRFVAAPSTESCHILCKKEKEKGDKRRNRKTEEIQRVKGGKQGRRKQETAL